MAKIIKTLRNNWKKSVFFSGLAIWGSNYGYGKYLEFQLMRAYCQEAVQYGDQKIGAFEAARHVTVLLNPVANRRKGKNDYEKYCAPLFHLAGMKVSVVVTEAEGQAKELMEIMENTDCVVVAGGDGTVHEAVTGLMRRPDSRRATKRFPIGILPIGRNNSIAYRLNSKIFNPEKDTKAKILAESTMMVIRETLAEADVMEISGERGRPVYSLGNLNMGQIQNVSRMVDQYWYLGNRMKPYLAYFFQSFRDLRTAWDDTQTIRLEYTPPCSGCSKCFHRYEYEQTEPLEIISTSSSNKRWWHSFMPLPKKTIPVVDPVEQARKQMLNQMKNTVNEECDQWQSLDVQATNLMVKNTLENSLDITVIPSGISWIDFIREGIRIFKRQEPESSDITKVKAKELRILLPVEEKPETNDTENEKSQINEPETANWKLVEQIEPRSTAIRELDDDYQPRVQGDDHNSGDGDGGEIKENTTSDDGDEQNNNHWIGIDNESYEIQSRLEIGLHPKCVQIYHGGF